MTTFDAMMRDPEALRALAAIIRPESPNTLTLKMVFDALARDPNSPLHRYLVAATLH